MINSAVLVPIYRSATGRLKMVIIRRSEGGVHGGQLAFPGGKYDKADLSLQDTALREAEEEIGLTRDHVQILTKLPIVETRSTGFIIHPFLARIVRPVNWLIDRREVDEVIEVYLDELARTECLQHEQMEFAAWGKPRLTPFYSVNNGDKLWGASFRIASPLLSRLLAGEWEI